jgi:hypothetical protein
LLDGLRIHILDHSGLQREGKMGWLIVIGAIVTGWLRVSMIASISVLGTFGAVFAVLGAQKASEWRSLSGIGSSDFMERLPLAIAWPFILVTACYWLGRGGAAMFAKPAEQEDPAPKPEEPTSSR